MTISNGMNKNIPFSIAVIIILACAFWVAALALWEYFFPPKIELLKITLPEKPAPKPECVYKKGESELRVYDAQGRVTGLVHGEVKREIPESDYYNGNIVIFSTEESYIWEIFGIKEDNYQLSKNSFRGEKEVSFEATDIPITPGETHRYRFDWDTLAQGKEGATIFIDSDGDGSFEKIIRSGPKLTCEEFINQVNLAQ